MRSPADVPRRVPRTSRRFRLAVLAAIVVVIVVISSARAVARFYTSYLWFQEVHFTSVFQGVLVTKILLAIVFSVLFFALMLTSLTLADRWAPRVLPSEQRDELVERYRAVVYPRGRLVRIVTAFIFALFAGIGTNSQWNDWDLFRYAVSFHVKDPQFHRDVGFYVFKLPFIEFLLGWGFGALVVVILVTATLQYLNGGIRFQGPGPRVTAAVKGHLSVLLAVLAVIQGINYYFERLELVLSRSHVVNGATATDVHANIPADWLLMFIAVIAAGLFVANIWVRGWTLPVVAVVVWAVVWIVVGNIYPAIYQSYVVGPSELAKETKYISRNIAATRAAYGLNAVQVASSNFDSVSAPDDQVVPTSALAGDTPLAQADRETLANVQVLDPTLIQTTFDKLQSLRTFYSINNLSIDRYTLDLNGTETPTETLLGVRQLNSSVPAGFTIAHLEYTHGYGAVVAPATQQGVSANGDPDFSLDNVPPQGVPTLSEQGAEIYYGEGSQTGGYVIANSKQPEIDYEDATGEATNHYSGTGGVALNSFVKKVAFALSFDSFDILLSSQITSHSRIMYNRSLMARVEKAAPFLKYDADPYAAIVNGQVYWIVDAYTVTNNYPYSQEANTTRVPGNSGLAGSFDYVRNSVKVVVNAYSGAMKFFVVDPSDPIIQVYEHAFPGLFTAASKANSLIPGITSHFRYPEDLFEVQTNMYGRYHLTTPSAFYNQFNAWSISGAPNTGKPGSPTQSETVSANGVFTTTYQEFDPEYELAALPGQTAEHFLLVQPFVPYTTGAARGNLTGVMFADADEANYADNSDYGQLTVYQTPPGQQANGPQLVTNVINSNTAISGEFTLLGQNGSSVQLGNVVIVPVDNTLLFVQPVYVEAQTNPVPLLRDVIVVYDNQAYQSTNASLDGALCQIWTSGGFAAFASYCNTAPANRTHFTTGIGGQVSPSTSTTTTPSTLPASSAVTAPPNAGVVALLTDAEANFSAANAALAAGNLGQYQADIKQAEADVARAKAEEAAASGAGSTPSTTTPKKKASGPTTSTTATTVPHGSPSTG